MRNRGAGCSCPSKACSAGCGSCFPVTLSSRGPRFRRHSGRRVQSSGPRTSESGWKCEGTNPGRYATRRDTRRLSLPEAGRPPSSIYPYRPSDGPMLPIRGPGSPGAGVGQPRSFAGCALHRVSVRISACSLSLVCTARPTQPAIPTAASTTCSPGTSRTRQAESQAPRSHRLPMH